MNDAIPYGYCRCGCGEQTRIATRSVTRDGQVKGEPVAYVWGHNPRIDPLKRFWAKVAKTDGCWLWMGSLTPDGYGKFWVAGTTYRVHRWAYETLIGPIPEGLTLDHLCRVRRCVNPEHLEPVTSRENVRRGQARQDVDNQ